MATSQVRALEVGAGLTGAALLMWLLWRRRVRAGLPGSVEPEEGGLDEAPAGSVDAEDDSKG
jgi:hypothetical protein